MSTGKKAHLQFVAIVVAWLALPLAVANAQPRGVRPLDPLSRQELSLADSLVRAERGFAPLLSGRVYLVSTDFIALKGDEDRAAEASGVSRRVTRVAELRYYAYEGDVGVRAFVDVSNRGILESSRFPGSEAPFAREEIAIARRIAEADPAVQEALRKLGDRAAALRLDYYPARDRDAPDDCRDHRCVQLFYVGSRGALSDPEIFVDLTSRRVIVRSNTRIR